MAQRPHTIVYEVHATPDAQRYRAECAKLSGVGATPLDAIRDLLDNEDHARRVLSTVYGTPGT